MHSLLPDIDESGYGLFETALDAAEVDALVHGIAPLEAELGTAGGLRDALRRVPTVSALARHPQVAAVARAAVGANAFAVRGIVFDKHSGANWNVPWHQDLTIAVRRRTRAAGYGPWSMKAGVPHVQPPVAVLERMVAVRIHLDDCGRSNGPLRVLPGSHRLGRLSSSAVQSLLAGQECVTCAVQRGGLVAMRPLLLHASSVADVPVHRRVVHLEFASFELPGGVEWFERWSCTTN